MNSWFNVELKLEPKHPAQYQHLSTILRSLEMMTRDDIRELAAFQADETKGACALSFYFQPDPPQDRSHRREAIVAKDVVKQALKSAAAQGKNGSLHADLDRVLDLATNLR
jgi:hypothetical protein